MTYLLVAAGIGALVAIVAGFAGAPLLIGLGAGAMIIALLLLPWLSPKRSPPPGDWTDRPSEE